MVVVVVLIVEVEVVVVVVVVVVVEKSIIATPFADDRHMTRDALTTN